ncbi:MAG TPA: hypothetical protein VFX89_14760 [Gammaproteobacteria bacterium]|nr:hypothetical protein [Gammaproteobacteria bacterium]
MPSRADFERLNALIAEAVALCEAAQSELERLQEEIQAAIARGHAVTESQRVEEERARARLLVARLSLTRRRLD